MVDPSIPPHKGGIRFDMTINVGHMVAFALGLFTIIVSTVGFYVTFLDKFTTINATIQKEFAEERVKIIGIENKVGQLEYRLNMVDGTVNAIKTDQGKTDNEIKDGLRSLNKEVIQMQIDNSRNSRNPTR